MPSKEDYSSTIEVGHFYRYYSPVEDTTAMSPSYKRGVMAAADFVRSAVDAKIVLFIDDFHHISDPKRIESLTAEEIILELNTDNLIQQVLSFFQEIEIGVPIIISELLSATQACCLHHILHKRNKTDPKYSSYLATEYGSSRLLTDRGVPTCALIDAAVYLNKLGFPSQLIPTHTFIPIGFKSEQKDVLNILKAVGLSYPPVTIHYFDDDGKVIKIEDWSKDNHAK